jgi:hypothetical protein
MNVGWQEMRVPLSHAHQIDIMNSFIDVTYGTQAWTAAVGTVRRICLGFRSAGPFGPCTQSFQNDRVYRYQSFWGTASNAAPVVTGTVALMLQKYQDRIMPQRWPGATIHDRPFWNSTAKALLIHTAEDLIDTVKQGRREQGGCPECANPEHQALGDSVYPVYGLGPDWATGYGLLNAKKAVEYVDTMKFREDTVADRQLRYYTMHVPQGTDSLRVTMVWDDPAPGGTQDRTTAFDRKIVNELDLYLIPPGRDTVYRPWFLDYASIKWRNLPPNDGSPAAALDSSSIGGVPRMGISPDTVLAHPAVRALNRSDNVEVVDIAAPDTGDWLVVVEGSEILDYQSVAGSFGNPRQDVSLVYDLPCEPAETAADTLGLQFCRAGMPLSRETKQGNMLIAGQSETGSLNGMLFGSAASITAEGDLRRTALYEDQGDWLDSEANLAGGLVVRGPGGRAVAHVSNGGAVRVRKIAVSQAGAM